MRRESVEFSLQYFKACFDYILKRVKVRVAEDLPLQVIEYSVNQLFMKGYIVRLVHLFQDGYTILDRHLAALKVEEQLVVYALFLKFAHCRLCISRYCLQSARHQMSLSRISDASSHLSPLRLSGRP